VGDATPEKEAEINKIVSPFVEDGLKYELVFSPGDPVKNILSVVEQKEINLLVLGALQRENIVKYYVGSIARKITRKANCSVLLLIKPQVQRIPRNHIVVNGLKDPKTEETIENAFWVGSKLGSKKITIVEEISQQEVSVKVDDDKSLRKSTIVKERLTLREDQRVKQMVANLPQTITKNIRVNTQPIFGRRGYSIGHYAQLVRADLLVMNAPVKTKFIDRLFPHDIEYILTELPTDVLIVR